MSDHDWAIRTWGPAPGLVVVLWVGAAAATAWCGLLLSAGADPAGQLIAGCAALGLLGAAVFTTRARPRLRADPDGLTVGGLRRSRHHPWPLVQEVRVLRTRRWGRVSTLLEIDTITADGGEQLLLFGRLDLNADPEDVAPVLSALRPG
ncbi:PH domain-containing protein [Pseudonocardia sp.]|uniref:PH domain-containing protein n=1 Tax=Pseudonocardia sp. TaxID=60912 RepID=UPI00262374BF|nr:PH domain-containing protein [Pseudonocardia sp.]